MLEPGPQIVPLSDEETEPFTTLWRRAIVDDFDLDDEEVYDGDTYTLLVDTGFDSWVMVRVRLLGLASIDNPKLGVDAWEVRGTEREAGLKARDRVRDLLPTGTEVRIWSRKGGSRGSLNRWLCVVCYRTAEGWVSIGDQLIEEGHAEEWWRGKSAGKPRPGTPLNPLYDYAHFLGDPIYPGAGVTSSVLCKRGLNARVKVTNHENTHYPDLEVCPDCREELTRRQSEPGS